MSPPASARAALQSMTPAAVRSRSTLTSAAETAITRTSLSRRRAAPRPHQLRSRTRLPARLGDARLTGSCGPLLGSSGRLLRLLAGALLGLGALALLLLVATAVFLRLALGLGLAPGLSGLVDSLADRANHQLAGSDRVVVPRNGVVDRHRVDVRVDQADDRDSQALGLAHRDRLGLQIDDQRRLRQALHPAYAAQIVLQLLELGLAGHALLGGQQVELALVPQGGQLVQALDPGRHRVEVGQQAAKPALVDIRHVGSLGPLLDRVASLLLGADEQDVAALARHVGGKPPRLGQQMLGLQQVDDVDPVALPEDVRAHARVPPPRLVAEVKAGLQQLLDSRLGHEAPLSRLALTCPGGAAGTRRTSCAGQGPEPSSPGVGYGSPG